MRGFSLASLKRKNAPSFPVRYRAGWQSQVSASSACVGGCLLLAVLLAVPRPPASSGKQINLRVSQPRYQVTPLEAEA